MSSSMFRPKRSGACADYNLSTIWIHFEHHPDSWRQPDAAYQDTPPPYPKSERRRRLRNQNRQRAAAFRNLAAESWGTEAAASDFAPVRQIDEIGRNLTER